jgi:hypothetical protein
MPQSDQIAAIVWAREQRSKGSSEADWINQGNGWVLGAYRRTRREQLVVTGAAAMTA